MKLTVYTVDGKAVIVKDIDTDTVQPLIEALSDDSIHTLAMSLDDEAMTYIVKRNITRVDVD